MCQEGSITQRMAYLLPDPAVPGLNRRSGVFSEKFFEGTLLSVSGKVQSSIVKQTHSVVASGKLVHQKYLEQPFFNYVRLLLHELSADQPNVFIIQSIHFLIENFRETFFISQNECFLPF